MTAPASSALDPAGVQASHIASLFWLYLAICAVVFLAVSVAFVWAVRTKRDERIEPRRTPGFTTERPRNRAVSAAVGVSCVLLVVMLGASAFTSRAIASLGTKDAVTIEVTARKWWWELTYPASVAGTQFRTSYELHIPVGRPIEIKLASPDVIHSFWVPSLHGKRDAIPGKRSSIVLQASTPGRYEGQCAEYCGTEHANMRFVVVAEPQAEFEAWLSRSRAPAKAPTDDLTRAGQEVFMKSRCIACHAIGGTDAFGSVGPDLTHIASRRALASGTLANSPGHLAGWIADPQSSKPGVMMPGTPLAPADLHALLAYLGSLE